MDAPAYDKLLGLLNSAKRTFTANADNLSPTDLRIRCLVNITAKEIERTLWETEVTDRATRSNNRAPLVHAGPQTLSPQ